VSKETELRKRQHETERALRPECLSENSQYSVFTAVTRESQQKKYQNSRMANELLSVSLTAALNPI
jgi:hypothetical protein